MKIKKQTIILTLINLTLLVFVIYRFFITDTNQSPSVNNPLENLPPSSSSSTEKSKEKDKVSIDEIAANRWFAKEQVIAGEKIYQENCSACHRQNGSGSPSWKKPLGTGTYPPPPLNGNAHTWHHPMSILVKTVQEGGIANGGTMPPFNGVLSPDKITDVLAYVQSLWPPEIYHVWIKNNNLKK